MQQANIGQTINVSDLLDSSRIGPFQTGILALCGGCLIMDGFDVQAMGYVAPAIIQQWGVDKASLGPVFGAGMVGMLIGSLLFSVLADRIGRRPVLIGATLFFSLCMLATPHATDLHQLLLIRLITGLGLGGIMPNAMALAGEFSPKRIRITSMMLVSCGFTMGAVMGGLVSAALIPAYGWQSVFYFGGIVPLVIGALMVPYLPESLQFQILRRARTDSVVRLLQKIVPGLGAGSGARLVVNEEVRAGLPVRQLFSGGRGAATMLLWGINFMNLLDLYFLSNWIPTVVKSAGFATSDAVLAGTALQFGGVLGTLLMGRIIDRVGFLPVLVPSFLVAAVTIFVVGQPTGSLYLLSAVIAIVGFCVIGGQPAINAFAANYYPTTLRSTGVGWSLGIGRFGSIAGPVLGGQLMALNWPMSWIFAAVAIPALLTATMIFLIRFTGRTSG